jgi:hypothetical protein
MEKVSRDFNCAKKERVSKSLANRGHRRVSRRVLDSAARVARVAGEKPCDIFGISQRRGPAQATRQEIEEAVAVHAHHRRDVCAPEFLFGSGKAVVFVRHRVAALVPAQKQKSAIVRDQDLVVTGPVIGNLARVGNRDYFVLGHLAFDDAAIRRLAGGGLIGSARHLIGREQPTVRH